MKIVITFSLFLFFYISIINPCKAAEFGLITDVNGTVIINHNNSDKKATIGNTLFQNDEILINDRSNLTVISYKSCQEWHLNGKNKIKITADNLKSIEQELVPNKILSACFSPADFGKNNSPKAGDTLLRSIDEVAGLRNKYETGEASGTDLITIIMHDIKNGKPKKAEPYFQALKKIEPDSDFIKNMAVVFSEMEKVSQVQINGIRGNNSNSIIVEVEGTALLGEDDTPQQTKIKALLDAKRNAAEAALTNIQSSTTVQNFVISEDLIIAKAKADVTVLEQKYLPVVNNEYKVKIKAEVTTNKTEQEAKKTEEINKYDPLKVLLWSAKNNYKDGEKLSFSIITNKDAYLLINYKTAEGKKIQIFPNQYWKDNFVKGGVTLNLPSNKMNFNFEVTEPYGTESIEVSASTSEIDENSVSSRGIKINKNNNFEEFSEANLEINTERH